MKTVFKSKIGLELAIPIFLIFATLLFLILNEKPSWLGLAILLAVIGFVVHLFATTYYMIEGDKLTIKCGYIINKQIDINSIKKISETNNPLSSPATSLDRLQIEFGDYDLILISPKLKKEFIANIISINPNIEVSLKKDKRL